MVSTPKVALLAFLLREAATAPFRDGQFHLEELVVDSPELNLATLLSGNHFGETEWALCELLSREPPGYVVVQCAGDLQAAGTPLLAESLLHAYGRKGKRTRAEWAEPFMARWASVRAAMRGYEAHGLAKGFSEAAEEAEQVYMEQHGIDVAELRNRYPLRGPEPVPACARDLLWDG
jgi:hypothetical protein